MSEAEGLDGGGEWGWEVEISVKYMAVLMVGTDYLMMVGQIQAKG